MTRIFIARHGNTFGPNDTPLRVGARTDLPLVPSGLRQAAALGMYLRENNIKIDLVFSGPLKRAQQTATQALEHAGQKQHIIIDESFNEIDYGPDEGKVEAEVIARIGAEAIKKWDSDAVVPDGWQVNPEQMIQDWHGFADKCKRDFAGKNILVTTSNGTARFAPYLTGNYADFCQKHHIKLSTGAVGCFVLDGDNWRCEYWNVKPIDWLEDYNITPPYASEFETIS